MENCQNCIEVTITNDEKQIKATFHLDEGDKFGLEMPGSGTPESRTYYISRTGNVCTDSDEAQALNQK